MKIQWEYDFVERPFCEQLQNMGWTWIEGDVDVPELTERANFRDVLLKERLAAALQRINLRNGEPWLDDTRTAKAIRDLEQAGGHRLMEINQSSTELLLKGTVAEGLPDWDHRAVRVRFPEGLRGGHQEARWQGCGRRDHGHAHPGCWSWRKPALPVEDVWQEDRKGGSLQASIRAWATADHCGV